jgi:hypothetical protein
VLDVMQDSFITRQLYYAEQDEPSKAQSMAIINSNPSTTARQVGDNLGVWENSALSWIVDKSIPWLHWESDRANGYATHPLRQLWDDTKDGTAMVAGLAENSVKAFFDYATNGAADGNVAADVRARPVGSGLLNALFTKIDTLSENVVNIVKAIEGQPGGAASTPVYVKQVPGTPMTLMPSTQTGHNPTLSPPVPGQVYNPK